MVRNACVVLGMLIAAQVAVAQFTQQGNKLIGSGAIGQSHQGRSVAISADGNTAIVGGGYTYDDTSDGGAWVFTRSGGGWSQQGNKLLGTGAAGQALQGYSVAISADGNTAIVGGIHDNSGVGAAWVFTRSNGVWSQQGDKLVGTGAVAASHMGYSVAISADGNTAIAGGAFAQPGPDPVWVFTRSGGVWTQQGNALVGSGGACSGPCFGWPSAVISADGNTAIAGWGGDSNGAGAAWVFTRSNGVWSQQGDKLVGSDALGSASQGTSVAVSADGSTAIVGGSGDNSHVGAAWVFTRLAGAWSQQGPKLVGGDAVGDASQGVSVAISADGNTAVVGGSGDDSGGGAAWVFTRLGGAWSQQDDKLVGTGAVGDARQGASVAISADGTTAIVGGSGDNSFVGAAWVFSAPVQVGTWVPAAAHTDGVNGSRWRSDLGLLNPGTAAANVEISFFGSSGVVSSSTSVPAGTQSIFTDVVGQLGATGQGALEILSDRQLKVTARTYNQAAPDGGCLAAGTQGQDFPVLSAGSGLAAGQSAYLPGLVQNADYRTNIGLVNTADGAATALVELFDGAGTKLAEYSVELDPGQWAQTDRPFEAHAGQTAMDRGYARITVQSGSGVSAFASVIDNLTHDPTTVAMQR